MKNLIMSVAKGYGWYDLEPFIISFKQNVPDADLVLFVDDLSEFTARRLKIGGGNITLLPIPDEFKTEIIINARWNMYKNFLDTHIEYSRVFVTDVRDVIFQGNLFEGYNGNKNFLVCAIEPHLIKNEPINTDWIKKFFGDIEYQKIADNPVICCGTVFGSRKEMLTVFEKMILTLKRSVNWGDEQAAMNYLIHNKLLPIENIIGSNVVTGEIFTSPFGYDFSNFIRGDKIFSGNGKVPAVVHQYDRHAKMIQIVDKIYREKYFQPDGRFTDARSSIEQTLCLAFRQNFTDATKIFVSNVFYANLNNFGDSYLKIWQMILQAPPSNPDAEILSVAVQKKLVDAFSANIDMNQLEKICAAYDFAAKNNRAIHFALKIFVGNMTLRFAEIFNRNGRLDLSLKYLERAAKMSLGAT